MKKAFTKKAVSVMAVASKKIAEISANTACIYVMHQPKLPESVKKLRKF